MVAKIFLLAFLIISYNIGINLENDD